MRVQSFLRLQRNFCFNVKIPWKNVQGLEIHKNIGIKRKRSLNLYQRQDIYHGKREAMCQQERAETI